MTLLKQLLLLNTWAYAWIWRFINLCSLNEIHSDEEIAEPAKNAGKKGKKDRKKKKEAELEEAMMEQEALANNDLADLPPGN